MLLIQPKEKNQVLTIQDLVRISEEEAYIYFIAAKAFGLGSVPEFVAKVRNKEILLQDFIDKVSLEFQQ